MGAPLCPSCNCERDTIPPMKYKNLLLMQRKAFSPDPVTRDCAPGPSWGHSPTSQTFPQCLLFPPNLGYLDKSLVVPYKVAHYYYWPLFNWSTIPEFPVVLS